MLKSTGLFLQMEFLLPSHICQCSFAYSAFKKLFRQYPGVIPWTNYVGNTLLCMEMGTDRKEGMSFFITRDPGTRRTYSTLWAVPKTLSPRRHPRIHAFSFPNASQSPLLLSASCIPFASKLQSLTPKIINLLL